MGPSGWRASLLTTAFVLFVIATFEVVERVLDVDVTNLNTASTIVLALVALALGGVIFWLLRERREREHERRRLRRAREEEAARFRLAFEDAPIGKALVGLDGRYLQVNESLAAMLGYSREELVDTQFQDVTHPDDLDADVALIAAVQAGELASYEMEKRYLRADGIVVWGLLSVSLVRDTEGAPAYFIRQVVDITDRKRAEAHLASSEAQLRAIFDSADAGILSLDRDDRPCEVNPAAAAVLGLDIDQPEAGYARLTFRYPDGRPIPPEDTPQARAIHEGRAQTGTLVLVQRPDGERRAVQMSAVPIAGAGDGEPAVVCSFADVTAREQALDELAAREREARTLASTVPVGIIRGDADGRWIYVNDQLREMWHMGPDQAPDSLDWQAGLHPDDRDRVSRDWQAAREAGGRYEAEFRIRAADGGWRWVWTRAVAEHDDDGRVIGFLATTLDTDARRTAEDALRTTEQLQRGVMRSLPGSGLGVYDHDLCCQIAEGGMLSQWGADGVRGRALHEVISAEIYPAIRSGLERALAGEDSQCERHSPRFHRDFVFRFAPVRGASGAVTSALVVTEDVTERRKAERAQREAQQRFEVAFERAPMGMAIVDLDGRFTRVNEALSQLVGYDQDAVCGLAPFALLHPDEVPDNMSAYERMLETGHVTIETRWLHSSGAVLWVDLRATLIRDANGDPLHVLAQVHDVTDRRGYEEQLEHLADHDPLTGLLNRRGFEAALERHLTLARRYEPAGALLAIDLDGFKLVNDSLGHRVGDELIIRCAGALRAALRESDVIARIGGDEFAVLLPGDGGEEAQIVADKLVRAVREHGAGIEQRYAHAVTASIGIAPFVSDDLTADEMLVRADLAMYEAKDLGKDRHATYSTDEHEIPRVQAQMQWAERIRGALGEDRFALHAQPVVDLQTGDVVVHEILLRMVDDDGDLIPPASFLPIAERFGLAPAVDRWVLERALDAMAEQAARGRRLALSVNLSGASMGDPAILELISSRLRDGVITPSDLMLEVTETTAVADIPRARDFSEALMALGCRLALDDFGAGFGSFSYLKHLPFDVLKLDGEFVKNAASNETDRLIIASVASLTQGLGKQTVAEFVPDDATWRLLLRHGVDLGQGFHLGRPGPLERVLAGEAPTSPLRPPGPPSPARAPRGTSGSGR